MKAVLISIKPKWCELIANGTKTIEVRKTKPKIDVPFKCYIYETQGRTETPFVDEEGHEIFKGRGEVIGEFVCDRIDEIGYSPEMHGHYVSNIEKLHEVSCVNFEEMFDYIADGFGYGWHISNLVIYDKPKELGEFKPYNRKDCYYSHLGYVIPRCKDCHKCYVKRPPQSYMLVEELGV